MMRAPSAATRAVGSVQDIDLERARLDPTAVFPNPEAVVEHPRLSCEQEIDSLKRWKYDACELELAEEENMGGGPADSPVLERVLQALAALGAETPAQCPPTKQGTN